MPLLGFIKEFAPSVELGLEQPEHPEAKRQTIRARRKDGRDPKAGDTLYLYTGLRTKSCRKLGEAKCLGASDILITGKHVFLEGCHLNHDEMAALAKADGFQSLYAFHNFFRENHGLPFRGLLIKW